MIQSIKEMPIPQETLYGGFIYSLANLLNNKTILTEVSTFKNINVTDFHKNKIYHKYTNQKSQQITFIQKKLYIPTYPFSIKGSDRETSLFMFDEYSLNKKGTYKIYFIDSNLTKLRKHDFIVIKPMNEANSVYVLDPMQDYILKMASDEFLSNYYVMGFSILENKRYKDVYFSEEEIAHLIK
jgi:hypothetical protein